MYKIRDDASDIYIYVLHVAFSPQKDHLFDSCEMSELISVTRTNSSCNTFINSYASLRHFLENCLNASNSTQHLLNRVFDEEHSAALSHRHFPFPMLLATILVFTIMILVGTFGSGLVIFVVLRKPSMRTRSNLFIMNLAISDLTLCLFTQPFTLYRLLIGHHPWALGSFMCKFSAMFQGTNIFVSTISITAIALDRFQCIVYPSIRPQNTRATIRLLCLAWLMAMLLASPLTYFSRVVQMDVPQCTERADDVVTQRWKISYSLAALLFQYVLPLLIVSVVYSQICLKIRQRWLRERCKTRVVIKAPPEQEAVCRPLSNVTKESLRPGTEMACAIPTACEIPIPVLAGISDVDLPSASPRRIEKRQMKSGKRGRRRNRPIILLAGIAIIFALSWLPLNVINVWMDTQEFLMTSRIMQSLNRLTNVSKTNMDRAFLYPNGTHSDLHHTPLLKSLERGSGFQQFGPTMVIVQTICLCLVFASACINPILYGWLNDTFRKEFHRVLFPSSESEGRCTLGDSSRSLAARRTEPPTNNDKRNKRIHAPKYGKPVLFVQNQGHLCSDLDIRKSSEKPQIVNSMNALKSGVCSHITPMEVRIEDTLKPSNANICNSLNEDI